MDNNFIAARDIRLTPNHSWRIRTDLTKYFSGPKIGDYMIASSGMTVGKNELFVRTIAEGKILEPFDFKFHDQPITLAAARARARLGKFRRRASSSCGNSKRPGLRSGRLRRSGKRLRPR